MRCSRTFGCELELAHDGACSTDPPSPEELERQAREQEAANERARKLTGQIVGAVEALAEHSTVLALRVARAVALGASREAGPLATMLMDKAWGLYERLSGPRDPD